ncbi:MAG: hypothetical protein JJU05_05230 [Verrucomicrobia bacterium]|nr:hypothetical protein [Verrucomicrobiota bacterium]MCH8525814.1 hypothetical protein [Kiritimatiellia bacterium]
MMNLIPRVGLLVAVLFWSGCEFTTDESDNSTFEGTETTPAPNNPQEPNGEGGQDTSPPAATEGSPIDLGSVVWLDANVSGWAQTSNLRASLSGNSLRLDHNQASQWPNTRTTASNGGALNGNCWVLVNVGGTWYAATFDWMRTGQTSKSKNSVRGTGGHIRQPPLNNWTPTPGETYGFMVTTPARTSERTINERSNVSMVTWQ